jgi:hypothetical protein
MLDDERPDPEEGQPSDERLTPESDEAKKAESEEDAEDDARKRIDQAFD